MSDEFEIKEEKTQLDMLKDAVRDSIMAAVKEDRKKRDDMPSDEFRNVITMGSAAMAYRLAGSTMLQLLSLDLSMSEEDMKKWMDASHDIKMGLVAIGNLIDRNMDRAKESYDPWKVKKDE